MHITIFNYKDEFVMALLHRTCIVECWKCRAVSMSVCGLLAKALPVGDVCLNGSGYLKIAIAASSNCNQTYCKQACDLICCVVDS